MIFNITLENSKSKIFNTIKANTHLTDIHINNTTSSKSLNIIKSITPSSKIFNIIKCNFATSTIFNIIKCNTLSSNTFSTIKCNIV